MLLDTNATQGIRFILFVLFLHSLWFALHRIPYYVNPHVISIHFFSLRVVVFPSNLLSNRGSQNSVIYHIRYLLQRCYIHYPSNFTVDWVWLPCSECGKFWEMNRLDSPHMAPQPDSANSKQIACWNKKKKNLVILMKRKCKYLINSRSHRGLWLINMQDKSISTVLIYFYCWLL